MGQETQTRKKVVVPVPSANLQHSISLSFVRCVACIGVVIIHVAWFVALAADDRHAIDGALAHNTWFTLTFNPEPPMQTFMCLTGFFATFSLVPALEATQSDIQTVLRYYQKRFLRIVPKYYLMLLIVRILVLHLGRSETLPPQMRRGFFEMYGPFHTASCEETMLHNVAFAHNQIPGGGCLNTTWTLAVQMHFWCLFPLALVALRPKQPGFRKRLAWTLLATIGAVLAYRAWQVQATQFWTRMPLPLFDPPDMETAQTIAFLAAHGYGGTLCRLAPLSFGALAALCVLDASCTKMVKRHSKWLHALGICLILSNFFGAFVNKYGPDRDSSHILANPAVLFFAYVFIRGVLCPLLPTMALVLTTTKQPGQLSVVTRFSSLPVFTWLANITYDIFLIHPLVLFCIWGVLPPSLWFSPDQPLNFALVSCLAIMTSVGVAWLHNRAWAIFMQSLRPRLQ